MKIKDFFKYVVLTGAGAVLVLVCPFSALAVNSTSPGYQADAQVISSLGGTIGGVMGWPTSSASYQADSNVLTVTSSSAVSSSASSSASSGGGVSSVFLPTVSSGNLPDANAKSSAVSTGSTVEVQSSPIVVSKPRGFRVVNSADSKQVEIAEQRIGQTTQGDDYQALFSFEASRNEIAEWDRRARVLKTALAAAPGDSRDSFSSLFEVFIFYILPLLLLLGAAVFWLAVKKQFAFVRQEAWPTCTLYPRCKLPHAHKRKKSARS